MLVASLAPRSSAQIAELWTTRFAGPGTKSVIARYSGTAADGSLRVFADVQRDDPLDPTALVGIASLVLVSFGPQGEVQWVRTLHQESNRWSSDGAMRVAANGCSYVASRLDGVLSLSKYSPQGDVVWTKALDLDWWPFAKVTMALDVDDRITLAGNLQGKSIQDVDVAIVQFDAEGRELWRSTYAGPGNGADLAAHMDFDGLGRVLMTGVSLPGPGQTNSSIFVLALERDGRKAWRTTYEPRPTDWVYPYAAHVARDGSTTIAASITPVNGGPWTNASPLLIRVDGRGAVLWTHLDPMPHGVSQVYSGIAIAPDGAVIVSGSMLMFTWDQLDLESTALARSFSSSGEALWTALLPSTCNNTAFTGNPLFDSEGRIVLLGSLKGDCFPTEVALMRYSMQGTPLEVHRLDLSGGKFDLGTTAIQHVAGDLRIVGSLVKALPDSGQVLFASKVRID